MRRKFFENMKINFIVFCCCRIGKWADKFGDELMELATKMTKYPEIRAVCIYYKKIDRI